ncbi:MAG: STAS domain-containing protein [Rubrobacteraceae bacterium]
MTRTEVLMDEARGAVRIEVREPEGGRVLVELSGEFDVHDLGFLQESLSGASSPSSPVEVDLSGVTFLDLTCARELVERTRPRDGRVRLRRPSRQAISSFEALDFGGGTLYREGIPQEAGGTLAHAV